MTRLLLGVALLLAGCGAPPDDCVCTEEYAPVCGDDGETYSNSCFAACAGVDWTAGACDTAS